VKQSLLSTGGNLQQAVDKKSSEDVNDLSTLQSGTNASKPLERWQLDVYTRLVEGYTQRHLVYSTDTLNAFNGLLTVLQENFKSSMLNGLPAAALDQALLWFPAESLPRGEYMFPTWSWVGWTGPVRYTHDMICSQDETGYPASEIETFEIHHSGTLLQLQRSVPLTSDKPREENCATYAEVKQMNVSGPDLGPNILQFWAWTVEVNRFRIGIKAPIYLCSPEHGNAESKQGCSGSRISAEEPMV
jgi:hypothetical protein